MPALVTVPITGSGVPTSRRYCTGAPGTKIGVMSCSPDFSPVLVFTKKYLKNTLGLDSFRVPNLVV